MAPNVQSRTRQWVWQPRDTAGRILMSSLKTIFLPVAWRINLPSEQTCCGAVHLKYILVIFSLSLSDLSGDFS